MNTMKTLWRRIMVLTLCAGLAASLAACGDSGGTSPAESGAAESAGSEPAPAEGGDTAAPEGAVTLTVWNSEVMTPGVQTSEVAVELAKRTGVTMDIIQGDAQKFSLLLAGGDLPDIIYSNPAQQNVTLDTLLDGGHLLELDDLIAEHAPNIQNNFPSRLDFSRQYLSGGKDKVFLLPVLAYEADPENPDISYSIAQVGLMTRWDVYAAIGYPEVNTPDEYLDVLSQMQQYARDNDMADGKQIYAISGWSDWGLWPWWLANMREMGYQDLTISSMVHNRNTDEVQHIYRTEAFWDSLKFYHKAYNMGILDPEAFTMKSDQFWDKCHEGQVMMAYASWQTENMNRTLGAKGHPEWGFEKLPSDGYPIVWGIVSPGAPLGSGADYANAITTGCKDPVAAIKFLDYCNSEEGARLIHSGIEGVHWETVDGVPRFTDSFMEMSKTDEHYRNKTGVTIYNKLCGFKEIQMLSDGFPADLNKSNHVKAENLLDVDRAYVEYFSEQRGQEYAYPGTVLEDMMKKGEIETVTDYVLFPTLVQQPDTETMNVLAQCEQYMNVQCVKVITAATEAEFDQYRQEAMTELTAKGFEAAADTVIAAYDQAKKDAETFEFK